MRANGIISTKLYPLLLWVKGIQVYPLPFLRGDNNKIEKYILKILRSRTDGLISTKTWHKASLDTKKYILAVYMNVMLILQFWKQCNIFIRQHPQQLSLDYTLVYSSLNQFQRRSHFNIHRKLSSYILQPLLLKIWDCKINAVNCLWNVLMQMAIDWSAE